MLNYKKKATKPLVLESELYRVSSLYNSEDFKQIFIDVKSNVFDINPATVVKAITGTEQDFIRMMDKANEYLQNHYPMLSADVKKSVLDMCNEYVFGYYVITPLILSNDVSDIKILAWNKVVCKAHGNRYVTDVSFIDEDDYNKWLSRIMKIHNLKDNSYNSLQHCTDRKGVKDFYLRIDIELKYVVSTECNNIHIRKMPKTKLTWDYLKENNMLTDEHIDYLEDRIASGYGFLISGRGGSGKSTLLNNMLDIIPFNQSILVSQESDELYSNVHPQIQFEHTMTVNHEGNEKEYCLEDELRLGLLQDIDNFIIGEIKGGEALHVFTTAMSTGARFFGTIHSNDARSSVTRLAQCARYVSDYPMETLEEMLTVMPFCLIHMSNFSIDEIVEIDGWDNAEKRLIFTEVYKK